MNTEYADLVYEGRKLCEADDLGYCGSAPRDIHDAQMLDSASWVHSNVERWYRRAFEHSHAEKTKKNFNAALEALTSPELILPQISDRKLAIAATKRKKAGHTKVSPEKDR